MIVDSTDPIGPAQPLFGPEFYGNVKRDAHRQRDRRLAGRVRVLRRGHAEVSAQDPRRALRPRESLQLHEHDATRAGCGPSPSRRKGCARCGTSSRSACRRSGIEFSVLQRGRSPGGVRHSRVHAEESRGVLERGVTALPAHFCGEPDPAGRTQSATKRRRLEKFTSSKDPFTAPPRPLMVTRTLPASDRLIRRSPETG